MSWSSQRPNGADAAPWLRRNSSRRARSLSIEFRDERHLRLLLAIGQDMEEAQLQQQRQAVIVAERRAQLRLEQRRERRAAGRP